MVSGYRNGVYYSHLPSAPPKPSQAIGETKSGGEITPITTQQIQAGGGWSAGYAKTREESGIPLSEEAKSLSPAVSGTSQTTTKLPAGYYLDESGQPISTAKPTAGMTLIQQVQATTGKEGTTFKLPSLSDIQKAQFQRAITTPVKERYEHAKEYFEQTAKESPTSKKETTYEKGKFWENFGKIEKSKIEQLKEEEEAHKELLKTYKDPLSFAYQAEKYAYTLGRPISYIKKILESKKEAIELGIRTYTPEKYKPYYEPYLAVKGAKSKLDIFAVETGSYLVPLYGDIKFVAETANLLGTGTYEIKGGKAPLTWAGEHKFELGILAGAGVLKALPYAKELYYATKIGKESKLTSIEEGTKNIFKPFIKEEAGVKRLVFPTRVPAKAERTLFEKIKYYGKKGGTFAGRRQRLIAPETEAGFKGLKKVDYWTMEKGKVIAKTSTAKQFASDIVSAQRHKFWFEVGQKQQFYQYLTKYPELKNMIYGYHAKTGFLKKLDKELRLFASGKGISLPFLRLGKATKETAKEWSLLGLGKQPSLAVIFGEKVEINPAKYEAKIKQEGKFLDKLLGRKVKPVKQYVYEKGFKKGIFNIPAYKPEVEAEIGGKFLEIATPSYIKFAGRVIPLKYYKVVKSEKDIAEIKNILKGSEFKIKGIKTAKQIQAESLSSYLARGQQKSYLLEGLRISKGLKYELPKSEYKYEFKPTRSYAKPSSTSSIFKSSLPKSYISKPSRVSSVSRISKISGVSSISKISPISKPSPISKISNISKITNISKLTKSVLGKSRITTTRIYTRPVTTTTKLDLKLGKIKQKTGKRKKTHYYLAYSPDFTSKAFGIELKGGRKLARRALTTEFSGFETRPLLILPKGIFK